MLVSAAFFFLYSAMKRNLRIGGMLAIVLLLLTTLNAQETQPYAIIIHGGAGYINHTTITPEAEEEYLTALQTYRDEGYAMVKAGASALEVVESTLMKMEDDPHFNAGKGAVFTSAGTNELDASIMEGKTLQAGAVAGVKTVKHPISAARMVMERSKHVMLSGEGAENFAKEQGLDMVKNSYFKTDKMWKRFQLIKEQEEAEKNQNETDGMLAPPPADWKFGTVGCVVLDRSGDIAAGTSTGGMTNKRWGRIGDSPIIGAGTYANNNTCGISCTGHGEFFIRYAVAHDISARMAYKKISLKAAAREVIEEELVKIGGTGGIVGIDSNGKMAAIFNTSGMFRAGKNSRGKKFLGIYENDGEFQGSFTD